MKPALAVLLAVFTLGGCNSHGAASQQPLSQQPAQSVATAPTRTVPQLFSYPLFIMNRIRLTDGATIKEVNDAIFKALSEKEQLAATPLVCAHPFSNDKTRGKFDIRNSTDCKTIIRTQTPDGDQFELLLRMDFDDVKNPHSLPDANEGSLRGVEESFPQRYADQAREWLAPKNIPAYFAPS